MTEELTLNLVSDAPLIPKKKFKKFQGKVSRKRKQRIEQRRKQRKKVIKLNKRNVDLSTSDGEIAMRSTSLSKENESMNGQSNPNKAFGKSFPGKSIHVGNPKIPSLETLLKPTEKESKYTTNKTFDDLNIFPALKTYIKEKLQLEEMTPVQFQTIPILLSGKDTLIRSETGSGKTLAYALSVVQSLQSVNPLIHREYGPTALVLTPTRELALQSYSVFQKLTLPVQRLVPTCLMGGQKRKSEKARLRKGVNIVVSTPGRLTDHIQNTSCLSLKHVKWLIFDEADRLLDMGFQKDITGISAAVKGQSTEKYQTVLLSATLTKGVENLVDLTLTDPERVIVSTRVSDCKTSVATFVDPATGLNIEKVALPDKLKPFISVVPSKLRLVALLMFIMAKQRENKKILIFFSCRDSVEFHYQLFKEITFEQGMTIVSSVLQLHGGMNQEERNEAVGIFKLAESSLMLCTDVAARGLDIPGVDWVVQYTSPGNPVDYIHRVGRTARAGRDGNALLFLTPTEVPYVKLLSTVDIAASEIKVEEILCEFLDQKTRNCQYNVRVSLAKERASELHQSLEIFVSERKKLKESAIKAFAAFIKAYATYPASLKHIFHVKNLHIGHVAKSFALKETPSEALRSLHKTIGQKALQQMKRKQPAAVDRNAEEKSVDKLSEENRVAKKVKLTKKAHLNKHPIVAKFDLMSEFSSGLHSFDTKKMKRS